VALHPCVGFVASVSYLHISSDTDGASSSINAVVAGGAFDFDLRPLYGLPIGFVLAYKLNDPTTRDTDDPTQAANLGFYYVGVRKLAVGLELGERWILLLLGARGQGFTNFEARVQDTKLTLAQVVIRYTW